MSKSNKTCYLFTQSFPYGNGETFVEQEIDDLAAYFKEVIVFPLLDGSQTNQVIELPENVKVVYLFDRQMEEFKVTSCLKQNFFLYSLLMLKETSLHPIKTLQRIRNLSSDLLQQFYRAEVLTLYLEEHLEVQAVFYSYWFDRWALILSIARERIGHGSFNFFSRAHGYEIFKDQTELGYHPFKRYMLSGVTKVYTVSKQGRDYLKHSFSKFSGKISYAYLGVKSNSVNAFNDNTFHILSCAHVRSIKRLDMVCDILAEMPQHVKIKWTLIGGGVDLANIKTKAATLPGNIACVFTGNLSSGEVLRYYSDNSISLFLSVSRSEGLPYTMMEAISFGIPLMATDVGGCSEICTDKTGIIIPKNFDPKEVANQIIDFSKSELNTPEFRAGVRQFWEENFNAQKNYHSFYQLISNYAA